jgi:hypothetical protein
MRCLTAVLIASSSLVYFVSANGKEPVRPKISPSALAVLLTTPPPPGESIVQETVQTCFTGYVMTPAGTCVKEVNEPASPVCPVGAWVDKGCELQVPYLTRCPPGFQAEVNGECTKIEEVPPQFYCPVDFYDDGGSCAKTTPGQVVTQCDIGELVGDTCVTLQRADYTITSVCPPNTQVEADGNCWKIVDTFDCSEAKRQETHLIVPKKQHVPLGKKVLVTRGKGLKGRRLGGVVKMVPPPVALAVAEPLPPKAEPCPEEMIAVSAPRPTKVNVASQVCHKKVQVDANVVTSCPPGYGDNGSHCVLEKVTPANTICISGAAPDGSCPPVTKRVPKYPGCPKESISRDGKCFINKVQESAHICPVGFLDSGSACVGVVEVPRWECPAGLTLADNNRCVGQKIRAPITLRVSAGNVPCEEPKPIV